MEQELKEWFTRRKTFTLIDDKISCEKRIKIMSKIQAPQLQVDLMWEQLEVIDEILMSRLK